MQWVKAFIGSSGRFPQSEAVMRSLTPVLRWLDFLVDSFLPRCLLPTLPRFLRRSFRSHRRGFERAGVLAAMLGYLIACFGMPIARPSGKDLSAPFPCATRACGCMSAESCWKDCCCFTREQKLAWAVEHGVAVPAYVLNEKPKSCCQPKVASCCQKKSNDLVAITEPAPKKSCCSKTEPASGTTWVIGIEARKCRGQGADWLSAGAVIPAPPRIVWEEQFPCIEELTLIDVRPPLCDASPPTPPPRLKNAAS